MESRSRRTSPSKRIQIFVGGVSPLVDEAKFDEFFKSFGPTVECRLVIDKVTRQSRGFGFVTYANRDDALRVLSKPLFLCGKEIECKDAMTKHDSNARVNEEKTRKIFVGGLPHDITQEQLEEHFGQYGEISVSKIICKHDTNVSRGFGFVIYETREAAQRVIDDKDNHYINGKWVDCKSAILRQEMQSPTKASKSKKNSKNSKDVTYNHKNSDSHDQGSNKISKSKSGSGYTDEGKNYFDSYQQHYSNRNYQPWSSASPSKHHGQQAAPYPPYGKYKIQHHPPPLDTYNSYYPPYQNHPNFRYPKTRKHDYGEYLDSHQPLNSDSFSGSRGMHGRQVSPLMPQSNREFLPDRLMPVDPQPRPGPMLPMSALIPVPEEHDYRTQTEEKGLPFLPQMQDSPKNDYGRFGGTYFVPAILSKTGQSHDFYTPQAKMIKTRQLQTAGDGTSKSSKMQQAKPARDLGFASMAGNAMKDRRKCSDADDNNC